MSDTSEAIYLLQERPDEHRVVHLAPRVQGASHRTVGHYGFALELTHSGILRVAWDDPEDDTPNEVSTGEVVFIIEKGTTA